MSWQYLLCCKTSCDFFLDLIVNTFERSSLLSSCFLLTLADLVADKIPGVDHVWDVIHTVMRPIAGSLVAAVSSHQTGADLLIPVLGGGVLAGMTHTTKAATRVVSTSTTAGLLNTI